MSDFTEHNHSPIMVNRGQQPPRDGEEACGLTYDATLRAWIYVASYSTARECQTLRTGPLQRTLGLPFFTVQIGEMGRRPGQGKGRRHTSTDQRDRYIPGWYAATYADPRAKRSPAAGSGFPSGRPLRRPIGNAGEGDVTR